jgi:hypothetical protein
MASITTRSGKGAPLTNAELDANFNNINGELPTAILTAQGDLLYASGANTVVRLAKDTTATRYLGNTGSSNNPAWAQINLTNGVTGTLPVGNGGTGAATFTANNVLLGNGTSAFQVVAPGTSGNVLTSNGTTWASAAPSVTTGKAIAMAIVFG